jgi:signal peptidase I
MVKNISTKNPKEQPSRLYHYVSVTLQLAAIIALAVAVRTFFYGLYQVPTGSMETTMLVGERFLADKLSIWLRAPRRGEIITFNAPIYPYSDNKFKNWFQRYIWGPDNWTKRVIGIPGDHVRGTIEDGKPVVYVNGVKLDEPYLNKYPLIRVWRNKRPDSEIAVRQGGERTDTRSFDPAVPLDKQPFYRIDPSRIVLVHGDPELYYPGTPLPEDIFDVKLGDNEYWVMGDNRLGSWDSRWWQKLDGKLIHGRIIFRIWSIDSTEDWWIIDLLKHPIDFWKRIRWGRCLQRVK